MIDWRFNPKNDQSRELSDSITDSKFNVNRFGSFTREIIQNSLDALDSDNFNNVKIVFETKNCSLDEIPGGKKLLSILKHCYDSTEHKETRSKYKKAIDVLNNSLIPCLKVSDYNTKGMDEEGWNTLINKVGASYKSNDSSAGRHGIGKKASFLMSLCNTVFYSSKNLANEIRVGGRSILTDWKDDDNNWYSLKGWFGDYNEKDSLSNVDPITEYNRNISDYFQRTDQNGTDVIIVALNDEEMMEEQIINSVLENFYIALKENKLIVEINKVEINNENTEDIIEKYYKTEFRRKGMGSDNIVEGLLKDYSLAYLNGTKNTITIEEYDWKLDLYLTTENIQKRKYYAFFRDHGMKIRDYDLGTDMPFSAIVVARGEELNHFLLSLENAAHDDFIIDKNSEYYREIYKKFKIIKNKIEDIIRDFTKLEVSDSFLLEGLIDMITYYGDISKKEKISNSKKDKKNDIKAIIQVKNKKKTKRVWTKDYKPFDIPNTNQESTGKRGPVSRPLPIEKEIDEITNVDNRHIIDVSYEKFFVILKDSYIIRFKFEYEIKNVFMQVYAKNNDDNINDVTFMVSGYESDEIHLSKKKDFLYTEIIPAGKEIKIKIKLIENNRYKLFIKMQGVKDGNVI